jgi:hypothetical protein
MHDSPIIDLIEIMTVKDLMLNFTFEDYINILVNIASLTTQAPICIKAKNSLLQALEYSEFYITRKLLIMLAIYIVPKSKQTICKAMLTELRYHKKLNIIFS